MDREEYQSARPKFLRSRPGLLDMLYNAWCKASAGLTKIQSTFNHLNFSPSTPNLPPYVRFIDENIICVEADQKRKVIEPFCLSNQLSSTALFISVTRRGCIGLKKDVLENHLEQAKILSKNTGKNVLSSQYALQFVQAFEFLKTIPPHKQIISHSVPPTPQYKIDPEWERQPR